jgi:hypothetical protein
MMLAPGHLRSRFVAWLHHRPDDFILRKLFAAMITATAVVLALDYMQLAEGNAEVASSTPQISAEPLPSAQPREDGAPIVGPLRRPDAQLAGKMSFDLVGDGRLLATGTIEPGSAKLFAAEVEKRGGYIKTIVLRSPGGSVSDALEMGRLIRQKQFSTEVEAGRYCASSCPLVFAGGVERRAGDKAVLGVHQVFAFSRDGLSPSAGMADAQRISAQCQKYLREMGVDLQVWTHAMETPKEQLYYFKKDELLSLKLATQAGSSTAAVARQKS